MGIRRFEGSSGSGASVTFCWSVGLQRLSISSRSQATDKNLVNQELEVEALTRQGSPNGRAMQEIGDKGSQASSSSLLPPSFELHNSKEGNTNNFSRISFHRPSYGYICLPVPVDRIDCRKWIDLPMSVTSKWKERERSKDHCPHCQPDSQGRKALNPPTTHGWPKLVDYLLLELLPPSLKDSEVIDGKGNRGGVNRRKFLPSSSTEGSTTKCFRESRDEGCSLDSRSHSNANSISQNRQVPAQEAPDPDSNGKALNKAQNIRSGRYFLHSSPFARLTGDFREAIVLPNGRRDGEEAATVKPESVGESKRPTATVHEDFVPPQKLPQVDSQGKGQKHLLKGFKLPVVPEIEKLRPQVEYLRSSFPNSSFGEIVEKVLHWGRSPQDFPDKQKLSSVQEFFRYTEFEGRKLFEELDADGDGQVRLEDLENAMKKRRLPVRYARAFLRRTRRNWFLKSFGWEEFQMLMEQKEATMLRAFNSLNLNASGTLQKSQVLASLKRAGLPATEGNARAMLQYLNVDMERGQVAYGQFRNFLLLLPPERLDRDPSMVWFEAATVVPMAPPVAVPAGSVLKSALAGGLASGLSTCIMHPLDTLKTRVQASPVSFGEVIQGLPKIGLEGLYRGSVPAIIGQFASHGLRTGVFEATKLFLQHLVPEMTDFQIQPIASLTSTVLGTGLRIPCEVLKQRLQAGMYPNVVEAVQGTLTQEGPMGLFRGTTATLCREVPFYVAGLLIYQEAKKVVRHSLQRELAPWETLVVGGVSGGLAAVCTTPFDVIKTRMMVASPGGPSGLLSTGIAIVASEGVLALYKGALPRFFWIAPLGAMNFAGYELAKQAMDEEKVGDNAGSKVLLSVGDS